MTILFGIAMFCTALFLIVLVLVQRGRGGGLSGALGGMGGQSAFGTKAGDVFTRFTIGAATFWILLCIAAILVLNPQRTNKSASGQGSQYQSVKSAGGEQESDSSDKGATGTGAGAGTAGAGTAEAPGSSTP